MEISLDSEYKRNREYKNFIALTNSNKGSLHEKLFIEILMIHS